MRGHIVIVGEMGSGKTTLGRALAARLGVPLQDSDEALMREQGITARELQERSGQDGLHRFEADHLLRALADPRPSVICAAASTIDDERCRTALAAPDVELTWLRASAATLAARQPVGGHRPPPVSDALRGRRARHWQRLRPHELDGDHRSPAELLDLALAAVTD